MIRESAARVADAERRPATRTRFVRRVFALSVLLHTAVVVFMAVWEMPSESVGEGHVLYVLDSERGVGATADPPRLFQFSTSATDVDSLPATPPIDCPVPPPPDVALANFVESAAGPVVDVRSLLSDRHAAAERALAGPTGAEFFGVQAAGNRFVFLIDCSVTMSVGTKWMEAMRQLTATMERLGEDQWFYVIFFSEESQPMFDTHAPEPHCLPATPENLNRLRRWLLTIKTGMSTQPARTLKLALSLDPDAIYLLSDGDFDPHDPSLDLLARERRNRATDGRSQVAVHTLCFLNSNLSGADKKKLQQIARQNGGSYACVPQGPRAISGTGD